MALYQVSSRYDLTNGGRTASRKTPESTSYFQYVSKQGDTFEKIAAKLFNDGKRYWEIADINPQVQWPDAIPEGTLLRVPR